MRRGSKAGFEVVVDEEAGTDPRLLAHGQSGDEGAGGLGPGADRGEVPTQPLGAFGEVLHVEVAEFQGEM